MPNEKVRFLKPNEEIKNKIIYIKDKDFLGFESANIHSFTFQLYKLEKFGVSKNFIYMEDDFFIGKPLKKSDFFYYDKNKKKVLPYLLTKYFQELYEIDILTNIINFLVIKIIFILIHMMDGGFQYIVLINILQKNIINHLLIQTLLIIQ